MTDPSGDEFVVIVCQPAHMAPRSGAALDSGIEILGRTMEVMTHEIIENDIGEARWRNTVEHPEVNPVNVHVLRPDSDMGLGMIEFDARDARRRLREHGREVARRFVRDHHG